MRLLFLLVAAGLWSRMACGQAGPGIEVPAFDDAYSRGVQQLEAGQVVADFQAFRYSYLESPQFLVAARQFTRFDSLRKVMRQQMQASDYTGLTVTTQRMLSINYTSMLAHKILYQTYKLTGDTTNAQKYKRIEFGLLNSITRKGDGRSCATAWPVISLDEEYFILEMLDAKLMRQNVDYEGGVCDRMQVREEGKKRTYFFEVSKVSAGYRKLGIK